MSARPPQPGFWRRRIVAPVLAQLTQGVTPDKLAATFALGAVCSCFPILGFTSLLNLVVGLRLRLNQPLLQALNQLLTPIHLGMIVVYVRLGAWLWHAHDDAFSVAALSDFFHHATFGEFLHRFGWAGLHAFTAWALTAPVLIPALYYGLRPVLRALALRRALP